MFAPSPTLPASPTLAALLVEKNRRGRRLPLATDGREVQMDLATWTAVRRAMLKPNLRFDLRGHLYSRDLYTTHAQHIVYMKASQMTISELAISYALWCCDERRANVVYLFPTYTTMMDFSTARVGLAVEASPYLAALLGGAADPHQAGSVRSTDRMLLKRIRDNFLYLRGAQVGREGSASQLKSIDADCIIRDEVDEMDPAASVLAMKRLGHSPLAESRGISTPTYTGYGIHAEFLESDQREWLIKCGRCGEWQPLTIQQVVQEWDALGRPIAWHGQAEDRAYVACRKCGRELDRLANGRWVASFPGRSLVGFHLTKLFSPTANLLDIIYTLQKTDTDSRRECFNQDLGLPFDPEGGKLTDADLDSCIRDYTQDIGRITYRADIGSAGRPFIGIDVGKVLNVTVRAPLDADGERRLLLAAEMDTFEEVQTLIRRLRPRRCVIDGLPETRKARELQNAAPRGVVWLAFYQDSPKDQEAVVWNAEERIVQVDRTRSMENTYDLFINQTNTLPANARAIPRLYDQLKAPTRVIEQKRGGLGMTIARYVNQHPDHYYHSENYCNVAAWGIGPAVAGFSAGHGTKGWMKKR